MPCDAACIKIIINTGFMAALAPVLAGQMASGSQTQNAARRLGEAARAHTDMTAVLGLSGTPDGFEGCDQARKLVVWIRGLVALDADVLMDKWTADIWSAIADLAAGKLP